MFNILAIILHLLAINIWVGGMFFIIMVLSKVIATLEVPEQHYLWAKILKRFFFWVWIAVFSLLGSGIGMILYRFGGFANIPLYILVMAALGLLMVVVFFLIYFLFYQRFKRHMYNGDVKRSREQLRKIRYLGIINMAIGLCVVVVIGGGPYFLG
jgi:uncharacterized membrane protein